jgi:hypothetical protein
MADNLQSFLGAGWISLCSLWLLTYLVHSTLLLTGVRLLTARGPFFKSEAIAEILWKGALLGGIITATVHVGGGMEPLVGSVSLPVNGIPAMDELHSVSEESDRQVTHRAERDLPLFDTNPDRAGDCAAPIERSGAEAPEISLLRESSGLLTGDFDVLPESFDRRHRGAGLTGNVAGGEGGDRSYNWLAFPAFCGLALVLLGSVFLGLSRARLRYRLANRTRIVAGPLRNTLNGLCREAGVNFEVRLSSSAGVGVPLAFGIFRPEICLPVRALTDLTANQQTGMLAHELAHITRRDPVWLTLAHIIQNVFFFQPLNRLARVRIQEISEFACDSLAAGRGGGSLPLARCLTEVAGWSLVSRERFGAVGAAGMAGSPSTLTKRIDRLLDDGVGEKPSRRASFGGWIVLAGLLAVITMIVPTISAGTAKSPPAAATSGEEERNRPSEMAAPGKKQDVPLALGIAEAQRHLIDSLEALEKERALLAGGIEGLLADLRRSGLEIDSDGVIDRLRDRLRNVTIRMERLKAAVSGDPVKKRK